jgi:CO dehydrogenase maturation factor
VDGLAENYTYTVLDNEAGMEHLSRGTTQNIDDLLIISGYSVKGIRAVARIRELVSELQIGVNRQSVIITSAPPQFDPAINEELARLNIEPTAVIPFDEEVRDYDIRFRPLVELPDTSKAVMAVDDLMNNLLNKN